MHYAYFYAILKFLYISQGSFFTPRKFPCFIHYVQKSNAYVFEPDCIGSQRDPRSTLRYGAVVLESRVEEGEFTVKCNNRGKMRDIDIEPYDEEQGIDGDRDNFIVYTKQPGIQLDDNKVDESTMKLSTDSGVPIEDIR